MITIMPGSEFYSFRLKKLLMGVTIVSTLFLPLFFILLSRLNQSVFFANNKHYSLLYTNIFTLLSVFLGAQFLAKIPVGSVFRVYLLAICALIMVTLIIRFWFSLSEYMIAAGGLWGTILSMNIKFGAQVLWPIIFSTLLAGVIATLCLYLEKDKAKELIFGFGFGVLIMTLVLLFT